ncbi:hypothetical protein [Comamonas fluminis]|uniref:hypothetical protein n=1 Tax=Comamonas fluminis TaxID=2796366 RepID=UPI001C46C2CA|nr:hypothetical protein [Comamonas fluminis]
MSRTATKTQEPVTDVVLDKNAVANIEKAQDLAAIHEHEKAELMDLGRRLGQMETAAFIGNISDGLLLSSFENVKKSKAWKLLKNKSGEIFPSLEAFCTERFGFSARRLSQIQGNRDILGQETFNQAEQLGLRQIDYNAIKALPAPDQELMRRAVEEAQSRDEVLDLLQELAARHAKEKEATAKEIEQLKVDNQVIGEKYEREEQRADKAEKALRSGGPQTRSLEERVADFSKTVNLQQEAAMDALLVMDQQIKALDTWYMEYVAKQPGYEPGDRVEMPVEVLALVQKLNGNVNRIASSVGGLQHLIGTTFGHELEGVTIHQMQTSTLVETE